MKAALAQAQALIEAGYAAQNAGRPDAARDAYEQALKLIPEHPTALQLMGLLARQRGDLRDAHVLMRRSLAVHPRQPHVWNNLANTQEDLGDTTAALASLEQALTLQPDYAQAHFNRARLLFTMGQWTVSLHSVQEAIRCAGRQAEARYWQLWAQLADALDGPDEALRVLDDGLVRFGPEKILLHDSAVLLQRLGRHAEALTRHEHAFELGLDAADADYNRGNTLQSLGQLQRAEQAYESALGRDAFHELAHFDLARLRWRLARTDWVDRLADAGQAAHASGQLERAARLKAVQAQLLWRAEQVAAARQAYQAAWQWDARPEYLDGMARCAVRLGDWDVGLQQHLQVLAQSPEAAPLLASYASSLMVVGRHRDALEPATKAVQAAPLDQYAWALLSTLYRATDPPRAQALLDAKFMHVADLPTPTGHRDISTFNRALADELKAQHRDLQAPLDQTLRGGTQTMGNLFDLDLPHLCALREAIAQTIDQWLRTLAQHPDHPFCSRHTGRWKFTDSWSSRLQSHGRHTNHVHPHGWISAVYYVEVPGVCNDETRRQGWLQFGQPDLDMAAPFPVMYEVQPRAGRLVLFPSYWWHGTIPFESPELRTTVAFDIVPTP